MSRAMTGPTALGLGLGLAALLFVSTNQLANRFLPSMRLDLTERQLFTLSQGTKNVLAKIDEPITLNFFYSRRVGEVLPGIGAYAQRVREVLEEIATQSGGKIDLHIYDPLPFSEVEDKATAAGMQGVPLEDGGEQAYFGLEAVNSTDDSQIIRFFQQDRERFLEYDLARLIQQTSAPRKKTVGLITKLALDGDPVELAQGRPSNPQVVIEQLRQTYNVQDIGVDFDQVPPDIDLLMIVQPRDLPDNTEYAIDQYVLNGGSALVFASTNNEFQRVHPSPAVTPEGPSDAKFDRLLSAWGVEMIKGKVVGDRASARKVNAGVPGKMQTADYLAWMSLRDGINKDDPVTGDLSQVNLANAAAIKPRAGAKTSFTPLLESSTQSQLLDAEQLRVRPDVLGLLQNFKPSGERYVMAARISGPAETAFPNGPPEKLGAKAKQAQTQTPTPSPTPQVKQSKGPIHVIVVADTDLLDDRFWIASQGFGGQRAITPTAGNGDLVQNAVESLTGAGDLINLRSRGSSVRPFDRVEAIKRAADDRFRAEQKQLEDKLRDAQTQLTDLRGKRAGSGEELTPEQTATIEQFRKTIVQTRQQLRQVQLALRQDIDGLKEELGVVNIIVVPALLTLFAVGLGVVRQIRRKRHLRTV